MNKRFFARYAFLAASLIWMGVIFFFSAQEGEVSKVTSGTFIQGLCSVFVPDFNILASARQAELVDSLQGLVRTMAHAGVYTVLGVFVSLFMSTFCFSSRKTFVLALAVCVLYAVSDEFHQYFVPGRSAELGDIFADSCGALLGMTLCCLCFYVNSKRKGKLRG